MFLVRGMDFFGGGRKIVTFLVKKKDFLGGKERWLIFW